MTYRLLTVVVATTLACAKTAPPPATAPVATYYSPAGAQPVQSLPGATSPRYPDRLRQARVEGAVVAQYVVDTTGRIMPGSLRIVSTSDTLFAAAVRDVVEGFRFTPATLNGRKIRQLVEQPVYFDMVDGTAKTTRAPEPRAVATEDPAVRAPMRLGAIVITAVARR